MKKRGQYSGEKNNTARTRQRLLDAVGEIIKKKGYTGLNVTTLTEFSGLNKSHLYYHFGDINTLVETYIREKDYWMGFSQELTNLIKKHEGRVGQEVAESLLLNQLDFFMGHSEMQQVILWQLCEKNPLLYRIGEERESMGERLFQMTDPNFSGSDVDIRAVSALLIAGIYHLVLHSKHNDSLFCGIDIRTTEGMDRIKKAIQLLMECTYSTAKRQREASNPDPE